MQATPSELPKTRRKLPREPLSFEEGDEAASFYCGSSVWCAAFAAYEEDLRFAEEEERNKNARDGDNGK